MHVKAGAVLVGANSVRTYSDYMTTTPPEQSVHRRPPKKSG